MREHIFEPSIVVLLGSPLAIFFFSCHSPWQPSRIAPSNESAPQTALHAYTLDTSTTSLNTHTFSSAFPPCATPTLSSSSASAGCTHSPRNLSTCSGARPMKLDGSSRPSS